jgi:hypothetical protein
VRLAGIDRLAALAAHANPLRFSLHSPNGRARACGLRVLRSAGLSSRSAQGPSLKGFQRLQPLQCPVAFGDAIAMAYFKDFFPRLNTDGSGMFAAFLLLTTAVILATGLIAGSRVVRE